RRWYCSIVGEYVVAFLLRILISNLMGIFCFYIILKKLSQPAALVMEAASFCGTLKTSFLPYLSPAKDTADSAARRETP
ncbi:hypothetical protein ABXT06_19945, partial [Flavobacterium sp. UW10123]|uniref:hypothetical protein n=1 Tax=Flavobacterium sp. UW10123 TaxID=3230800 RepID=UPI0033917435